MEKEALFSLLGQQVKHRIDIYLAPLKIDRYFRDQGFPVNEIAKSEKEGQELGVSIFKVISGKVSGGQDITEKIVLDSRDKGKIIEQISFEDSGDVTSGLVKHPEGLIHYQGPAHFTYWKESFESFSPVQNKIVQKERERQEMIMEKETVVFSFKINDTRYVSIAAKEHFDIGMLASYGPLESHGILGLPERKLTEDIVLINPFWIWHEE